MKNSIIIFIRRNWLGFILWFLNILSIIFILQIVFDVFPLFESKYPLMKVNEINSLVVDSSIGIITSTLFYILLVYIPENRKSKTARKAQKLYLQFLAEHMQFFIIYLIKTYSLDVRENDRLYSKIIFEEFGKIDTSVFTIISKSYPLYVRSNSDSLSSYISDYKFGINEMYKNVNRLINEILSNPIIVFEDEKLIDLLNEILSCKLFQLFIAYKAKNSILDSVLTSDSLKSVFVEYYKLYIRLLKYSLPNSFFISDDSFLQSQPS